MKPDFQVVALSGAEDAGGWASEAAVGALGSVSWGRQPVAGDGAGWAFGSFQPSRSVISLP